MSNPVFKREENLLQEQVIQADQIMTVNGTINATATFGLIMVLAAAYTWTRFSAGHTDLATMLTYGGLSVGFISAMIIIFARQFKLIPIYAVAEGLFLGGISAMFESSYPGIVFQAVVGTFAAFFTMLFTYRAGLIKCTERFRSTIIISTISIGLVYLLDFIGGFFGYAVPVLNSDSNLGILVSAAIVIIAALNLILDFDFIEKGEQRMLPKSYEWYGAFGLLVTIVWLYIEILKLLAKLNRRN